MNNGTGRLFFQIVFVVFFSTLFYHAASGQGWGKVTAEEWKLSPPGDYPEANAVVIFDRGTLKVMLEMIKFTRHVRMKVLTKAGIEEIGDVEFTYDDEDKITSLDAQTITPDGKKHKVDKKDFYTKSAGGSKVKSFSFPALDSGCIVEYCYTNMNQRHLRIDPWFFQSGIYTLSSEYNLILEAGFTYSSATIKVPSSSQKPVEEFLPNTENIGDPPFKSFTWTMSNLPPVKSEPYMSFSKNYMASIYNQLVSYKNAYYAYTYVKNWSDLGQKFQESLEQYVNDKKTIKELVDSLTSTLNDKREKVRVLYEYMLREINTREDADGHWYAHEKLSGLLQERSGTEDEKNILYVEMLKAAGIPAWPVLIGRRDRNVFLPQLFQMHQFDHVIALADIDSSYLYLDTESKYCPFGILPPKSRSTGGLQIDGKNSQVTRVTMVDPVTSRVERTRMHIAGDGSVACTTMVKYKGYYATEYGELYESKKPEDFVKEYFLERLGTAYTLDTPSFRQESPDMLQMDVSYKLDNYARRLDKNLLVKPVCYHFRENPFKSRKRSFPVDFNYPFVYQNTVEIYSNDSLESYSVPQPLTISIPGASFTRNCMYDGAKIIVDSRLAIERPIFLPDLYVQLRDFFTKVASAADEEVVLTGASD